jgi:hypothetical protein
MKRDTTTAYEQLTGDRASQSGCKSGAADHQPNAESSMNAVNAALRDMARDEANAAPDYRCTLLPDGMPIRAFFRHSELLPSQRRWIGHFTISPDIESEFAGMPIIAAWNPPQLGRRLSPRHNLARDYRAVTGLSARPMFPKKHGHRAILGMFLLDAEVHAITRLVGRRMDDKSKSWVNTDSAEHYSVISELTGLASGTPPVLQKRQGTQR